MGTPGFEIERGSGGITALRREGDPDQANFVRDGAVLGAVNLCIRQSDGPWHEPGEGDRDLAAWSRFSPLGTALRWEVSVHNDGDATVELGDLALPLPMHTDYTWDHQETATRCVFKHAFIAGHGSFLYWVPVRGSGWFLVLQPDRDTSLEYFTSDPKSYGEGGEVYAVYVHALAAGQRETRGTWRQPRTGRILGPGEQALYAFTFRWAQGYAGIRDVLYAHGGVDVHTAPGMVIPTDSEARVALRTQREVARIEPEFPEATTVRPLENHGPDTYAYGLRLRRLGENRVTVHFRDGGSMPLEYFATQPLETLFKKRAAFIVRRQQHRDPSKWYDGLFSLWEQRLPEGNNLLGPDHLGGQYPYCVAGSDDPSNSKCLFLAEKNVAYPEAEEIEALEYFAEHFVWGKHQRTDRETPYPYGIYGSESWEEHRGADRDPLDQGVSRPGGPSACHMWRTYDYTTYFAFYFNLYRIAKQRPDLVRYLNAAGYLERAYGTARAYFEVPAQIYMDGGWTHKGWVYWQYTTGNFHEKYLLPMIEALEEEGRQESADFLRNEWEKKVKYFIYDDPWPFASEMPIDSTAFESTYAAADYAVRRGLSPDQNLWFDRNQERWYSHPNIDPACHTEFLRRQHAANLACRGVLEANYWSLGSDFRGCGSASYTLSYMSQMGGWSVLDYALRHDPEPAANLRLGYASLISSWALMNAGDEESDYGYWTPGPLHDGSVGWGFQPRQVGSEWNRAMEDLPRGAWPVCGEIDHGLVAGIEAARAVLFDDPVFGPMAFGGEAVQHGTAMAIIPLDGVRQRFSGVWDAIRIHVELDRDGFAEGVPIQVARDGSTLRFCLESRAPTAHTARIRVEGLPEGMYRARTGTTEGTIEAPAGTPLRLTVCFPPDATASVTIELKRWVEVPPTYRSNPPSDDHPT